MPAQVVADLRTLVVRRAGERRKVALLVGDDGLKKALEGNGCTVLLDPPSLEALAAFGAEQVVAFDGFLRGGLGGLESLSRAAPAADLVLSFATSSSATALVAGLVGSPVAPALAEAEVRDWLAKAGYAVTSRDVAVEPHRPTTLSADTEAALRALFEQVNPDAAADRVVLVARHGAEAAKATLVDELVSVAIATTADAGALAGTVASLVRQAQRPLELLVAGALTPEVLDAALSRARSAHSVSVVPVPASSADSAGQWNAALARATGRLVTFVEAGELLEPWHLQRLAQTLRDGTAAWAVAPVRFTGPVAEAATRYDLAARLETGVVAPSGWLVDRSRLGPFPLTFAEGSDVAAALLEARLSALFPPQWLGGNAGVDCPRAARPVAPAALLEPLRARPLRWLTSLEEVLRKEEPSLAGLLRSRVAETSPVAAKALGAVEALAERVRKAAEDARAQARAEATKSPVEPK